MHYFINIEAEIFQLKAFCIQQSKKFVKFTKIIAFTLCYL